MIEMRWLESTPPLPDQPWRFILPARALQYRQIEKVWIPSDPGTHNGYESEAWSEWKTVPTVSEAEQ